MIIKRENTFDIVKEKIDLDSISNFSLFKYLLSKHILKKVISREVIDTFDFITIVRTRCNGNIEKLNKELQVSDFKNIKYNCFYLCNVLKKELEKIGINCNYVSYKANGFSTHNGDEIIKEAHVSLVWITKRKNKVYITIYDPGLYINKPISFYKDENSKIIKIKKCKFSIIHNNNIEDNELYPYMQVIDGKNKNCFGNKYYSISHRFNPLYETKNLNEMLHPISLSLLVGFKVSNINNRKRSAYIKLILLSKYIEYYNANTKKTTRISFEELQRISKLELKKRLLITCNMLNKDIDTLIDDIYFIVDNYDEYLKCIINKKVLINDNV